LQGNCRETAPLFSNLPVEFSSIIRIGKPHHITPWDEKPAPGGDMQQGDEPMQQWPKRIRNLVLLGMLLASLVGVASVLMASWVGESMSKPKSSAGNVKLSEEQRAQRPVDVF
jgi:hypothetical protein